MFDAISSAVRQEQQLWVGVGGPAQLSALGTPSQHPPGPSLCSHPIMAASYPSRGSPGPGQGCELPLAQALCAGML